MITTTGRPRDRAVRVMLIESEPLARKRLVLWLKKWGYQVLVAESTALSETAVGWKPDVILADCPRGDRCSRIQIIQDLQRRFGRSITTVLAIADVTPRHLQAARQHNCLLLPRPIRPARLQAALRYCLLHRQLQ